jgi:hypothetical protein
MQNVACNRHALPSNPIDPQIVCLLAITEYLSIWPLYLLADFLFKLGAAQFWVH